MTINQSNLPKSEESSPFSTFATNQEKNEITCDECGHVEASGSLTCRGCGAPVKPKGRPAQQAQDISQSDSTAIWNPWIASGLGVLLGYPFSTILAALNWHSLKRHWIAGTTWFAGSLFVVFVQDPASTLFPWPWPWIVGFIVWFPIIGLPQILYLKKHRERVTKPRSWLLPVSLAVAGQAALFIWMAYDARQSKEFSMQEVVTPQSLMPSTEMTSAELYRLRGSSVVEIQSEWTEPFLFVLSQTSGCTGSGVLLRNKPGIRFYATTPGIQYYVTNRHVVEGPSDASNMKHFIKLDQQVIRAEVVAYGKGGVDLALLRIEATGITEDQQMPMQLIKELKIGQKCVAIGNTLGEGISLTEGVVSHFDNMEGVTVIRTSASISHGNSGGALFSVNGAYLIGITTAGVDASVGQNINFAIPADYFATSEAWEYLPGMSP